MNLATLAQRQAERYGDRPRGGDDADSARILYAWFGSLAAGAIEVPIHDVAAGLAF
jgi:hypothetical protein